MNEADSPSVDRPDPRSFGAFISRALDRGGLKDGIREAARLLQAYDDREIRKAAEDMPPKVRTAILKMVALRHSTA